MISLCVLEQMVSKQRSPFVPKMACRQAIGSDNGSGANPLSEKFEIRLSMIMLFNCLSTVCNFLGFINLHPSTEAANHNLLPRKAILDDRAYTGFTGVIITIRIVLDRMEQAAQRGQFI